MATYRTAANAYCIQQSGYGGTGAATNTALFVSATPFFGTPHTPNLEHARIPAPVVLWHPQQGATLTAYGISAGVGSFNLNGQAATLKHAYRLVAALGSFALNGQNATLKHAHRLAAALGSFAFSGQPAQLKKGSRVVAALGSFALSGQPASLVFTPSAIQPVQPIILPGIALRRRRKRYRMEVEAGIFYSTWFPARLIARRRLRATESRYRFSSQAARCLMHRRLPADTQRMNVAGQAAQFEIGLSPELRALLLHMRL